MKTNFKNEKQIASMIILTVLLILSVIMVVNFGKAGTVNTFTFTNSGNTYSAEFEYESVSREGEVTSFRITKIEQKDNTSKIVCPTEIKVPDNIIIGSNSCKITSIGGGKGKPFICDDTFNGGNLKNVYDDLSKNKGFAITLPDSVTTVNDYAFSNGLNSLTSETYITKLAKITMNKVSVINDYAFCNCGSIKSVSLGSVQNIGNYAFYSCSGIESVSLGSVQNIGNYAFYSCNMLENVIIPKRLFPTKILLQEITLQQNLFHMVIIRKVEKQSLPDAISLLLILLLKLFSLQMAVICIQTARLQILLILPVTVYILLMYISPMK